MMFDPQKHLSFATRKMAKSYIDNTLSRTLPGHVIYPVKIGKVYAIRIDGFKLLSKKGNQS